MSYIKGGLNPVFIVALIDQYGEPVVGVTTPTVYVSKSQGADTTIVHWVETTDFTWHELTSGEACKGLYKLRQVDAPNVDATDTGGTCTIWVYKTQADTALGATVYFVVDYAATGTIALAAADAVWDAVAADHVAAGSTGEALDNIPTSTSVIVGAVTAVTEPGNRTNSPVILEIWRGAAKTFSVTVNDADGDPVDLSGMTLRFVVQDTAGDARFKIDADGITVSGTSNEVANVTVDSTNSATAEATDYWHLWDTVTEAVLAHGQFIGKAANPDT